MNTRILTSAELRLIEQRHADLPLMQRAGIAAAAIALEMLDGTPLIVAGPGNNGGDAFVLAHQLRSSGIEPVVLFTGDAARLPADARRAHDIFCASGGSYVRDYPDRVFGLIVDGLFGIGLARPIEGNHAQWIERINASGTPVLALDIPSGLNSDTGCHDGPCIYADRTVTFIALKPGLLTADGPDCCGEITLCDLQIGIGTAGGQSIETALFRNCLQPRLLNSHKGSYGSVAILGGAPGMAGAALLAGRAALKLGAGRVYLGMLETLPVDPLQPELMLRNPGDALAQATILAIGPGLGLTAQAAELMDQAIACALPLIIDADAINLLATEGMAGKLAWRKNTVPSPSTFLTPHPAEAARLLGRSTQQIQADRPAAALELAQKFGAFTVLKGHGSIVATPDGNWFINTGGNPGLATAGSGDVLTGILAALLAQHWPPLEATLGAVHLHGKAADACAAAGSGPVGLVAGELIDASRGCLNAWIKAAAPTGRDKAC